MIEVSHNLNNFIANERHPLDSRDISSRYTCDVISNCLLGIDARSFDDKNCEIYNQSKEILRSIGVAVTSMWTKKCIPANGERFFTNLVKDSIKYRKENQIARDDFLAHVIATKEKKNLNEVETTALAWNFYMNAYDTSAIGLHYMLYELANNQKVQNKLRDEISSNLNDEGAIEFEKILELEYLDQVFYETLRLHPPLTFTTKVCSEPYELNALKGHKTIMPKGATALISFYSIHRDPG
jgi:cytochrome P450